MLPRRDLEEMSKISVYPGYYIDAFVNTVVNLNQNTIWSIGRGGGMACVQCKQNDRIS